MANSMLLLMACLLLAGKETIEITLQTKQGKPSWCLAAEAPCLHVSEALPMR
jgi:hypothetical protein